MSKLCAIKTLAIYNPGSPLEAVPLWPFLGPVAAEVSQYAYRWPSLYFHRVKGELGMGRGSCSSYHTPWLLLDENIRYDNLDAAFIAAMVFFTSDHFQ